MDFEAYVDLVTSSAAAWGYDRFLPSLCVCGEKIELNVLEIDLGPDGEKSAAFDWAEKFVGPSRTLFCAYRAGDRKIEAVEITGTEVTRKHQFRLLPYAGDDK